MTIDELSATYANMNEDTDTDEEKEEKAPSGGDEFAGGERRGDGQGRAR